MLHYASLFVSSYTPPQNPPEIGLPELLTMQSRIILEHSLKHDLSIESHGCYIHESHLAEHRPMYGHVEME